MKLIGKALGNGEMCALEEVLGDKGIYFLLALMSGKRVRFPSMASLRSMVVQADVYTAVAEEGPSHEVFNRIKSRHSISRTAVEDLYATICSTLGHLLEEKESPPSTEIRPRRRRRVAE